MKAITIEELIKVLQGIKDEEVALDLKMGDRDEFINIYGLDCKVKISVWFPEVKR